MNLSLERELNILFQTLFFIIYIHCSHLHCYSVIAQPVSSEWIKVLACEETNLTGQDCSGNHSKRKLFTLISRLLQTQSTKRSKKCHNHYLLQERTLQDLQNLHCDTLESCLVASNLLQKRSCLSHYADFNIAKTAIAMISTQNGCRK